MHRLKYAIHEHTKNSKLLHYTITGTANFPHRVLQHVDNRSKLGANGRLAVGQQAVIFWLDIGNMAQHCQH